MQTAHRHGACQGAVGGWGAARLFAHQQPPRLQRRLRRSDLPHQLLLHLRRLWEVHTVSPAALCCPGAAWTASGHPKAVLQCGVLRARTPCSAPVFSPQHSFFCRLTEDKKSEKFFKVFYDRMKVAQQEIKATVTVNTSDLGNKKKDEEADRDAPSRKKGEHPHPTHTPVLPPETPVPRHDAPCTPPSHIPTRPRRTPFPTQTHSLLVPPADGAGGSLWAAQLTQALPELPCGQQPLRVCGVWKPSLLPAAGGVAARAPASLTLLCCVGPFPLCGFVWGHTWRCWEAQSPWYLGNSWASTSLAVPVSVRAPAWLVEGMRFAPGTLRIRAGVWRCPAVTKLSPSPRSQGTVPTDHGGGARAAAGSLGRHQEGPEHLPPGG